MPSGTKMRKCRVLIGRQLSEREQRDQREWETDGYGRPEWSSERCDGSRGPGRMSAGRQRWGFSACDGSTWKNTSSFPPVPYFLSHVGSRLSFIFPYTLLSLPSASYFLTSPPPYPAFMLSTDRTRPNILLSAKSKSPLYPPVFSVDLRSCVLMWPLAGFNI